MCVCHVCRVDQKQKLENRDKVQARAEGWSPGCLGAVRGSLQKEVSAEKSPGFGGLG